MNPVLNTGVLIGVLCGLWTFVMGWTGWYKDPARVNIFFLVILIEVAGLIWGLRRTAREGRGYGAQIVAGTMMAIIAGVVIIGASLLFTTVFFPDYFQELASAYAGTLRQRRVVADELALAEKAREHTAVGSSADHASQVLHRRPHKLGDAPPRDDR